MFGVMTSSAQTRSPPTTKPTASSRQRCRATCARTASQPPLTGTFAPFCAQRRWSCGPMQLWAAARQSVTESNLPAPPAGDERCVLITLRDDGLSPLPTFGQPLHKAYLNIFFFGVRMLATNVIEHVHRSARNATRFASPSRPRPKCRSSPSRFIPSSCR